jgi:class 3 adenylate cyclase
MCVVSRVMGILIYDRSEISLWSTVCVFTQIVAFLACTYIREIGERKRYLLHLHVVQTRSALHEMQESMIPDQIAARVRCGEPVVDSYEQVSVLLCSFSHHDALRLDALGPFHLLDQLHQAFDSLLAQQEGRALKIAHVGNDYMLVSPNIAAPAQPSACGLGDSSQEEHCAFLGSVAIQMASAARRLLAGSGMDARLGLASGPAFVAVIGESRRHLSILGPAASSAAGLCAQAAPGQVLCDSRAAAILRSGHGFRLRETAAAAVAELCGDAPQPPPPPPAAARRPAGLTDAQHRLSVREALADAALAGQRISAATGALADPAEEARFRLETGAESPDPVGARREALARTACVAACQAAFLLGLPGPPAGAAAWAAWWGGPDGAGGWEGRVRAGVLGVSLAAAALSSLGAGARPPWAAMHGAFFLGLAALAHARPEPFLLLGFAMGAGLCFVAPPTGSAAAAGRGVGAAYAVFLAAFCAASAREGLPQPSTVAIVPMAMLVHGLAGWLRGEARAARTGWLLEGARRRERAALFGALRELLPEHAVRDLGGAAVPPHVAQAVVLRAEIDGFRALWGGPCAAAGGGVGEEWRERGEGAVRALHELLARFDREVRRRGASEAQRAHPSHFVAPQRIKFINSWVQIEHANPLIPLCCRDGGVRDGGDEGWGVWASLWDRTGVGFSSAGLGGAYVLRRAGGRAGRGAGLHSSTWAETCCKL